ncbi:MAG: hypothetical protein MI810_01040, partial [Flavobacteriales bacterium]|nr:hypothetical protein [Flavobacteriales bacterium]
NMTQVVSRQTLDLLQANTELLSAAKTLGEDNGQVVSSIQTYVDRQTPSNFHNKIFMLPEYREYTSLEAEVADIVRAAEYPPRKTRDEAIASLPGFVRNKVFPQSTIVVNGPKRSNKPELSPEARAVAQAAWDAYTSSIGVTKNTPAPTTPAPVNKGEVRTPTFPQKIREALSSWIGQIKANPRKYLELPEFKDAPEGYFRFRNIVNKLFAFYQKNDKSDYKTLVVYFTRFENRQEREFVNPVYIKYFQDFVSVLEKALPRVQVYTANTQAASAFIQTTLKRYEDRDQFVRVTLTEFVADTTFEAGMLFDSEARDFNEKVRGLSKFWMGEIDDDIRKGQNTDFEALTDRVQRKKTELEREKTKITNRVKMEQHDSDSGTLSNHVKMLFSTTFGNFRNGAYKVIRTARKLTGKAVNPTDLFQGVPPDFQKRLTKPENDEVVDFVVTSNFDEFESIHTFLLAYMAYMRTPTLYKESMQETVKAAYQGSIVLSRMLSDMSDSHVVQIYNMLNVKAVPQIDKDKVIASFVTKNNELFNTLKQLKNAYDWVAPLYDISTVEPFETQDGNSGLALFS